MSATYWSVDECRWVGWTPGADTPAIAVESDVAAAVPQQGAGAAQPVVSI